MVSTADCECVDITGYFSNMAPSKGDKRGNVKKKNKSKSAKQRMRSIKRLLSKPDLPATVRVSQERMLHLLQNTLEEEQQSKKDGKMIKKYKMVKFFEKRKLWRQHRAAMKELKGSPTFDRVKELDVFQKKIQRDMNYIEYFPSDRKYISLFPAKPYTNQTTIDEQEELYKHINKKVDARELPPATMSKNGASDGSDLRTKRNGSKTSKPRVHMDEKKSVGVKPNFGLKDNFNSNLDGDDFFIDSSGDQSHVEL